MQTLTKERRRCQRIPLNCPVKYKVLRRGLEPDDSDNFIKARARDIAEYGIGIVTYEQFQPGDVIRVDFKLGEKEIHSVCAVAWSDEVYFGEELRQYAVGLEFEVLTNDEKIYLGWYFDTQFESIWNYLVSGE